MKAASGRGSWWGLFALLLLWEMAGRWHWVADGALPAPSAVLVQWWSDRAEYPAQIAGTLRTSAAGFVIGNLIAIACGCLFVRWPLAGRAMAGVNVTIFAMPAIALVPVLVIALDGETPRVVLAALSVYYPTMVATVLGLSQVDARLVDLVHVYGGGEASTLRFVRWRSALPAVLSGLRVAAPAAVLGSLLAEFGSGGSAGLGTYLIGSLGRADPARLWGIGLTATAISALAYFAVDWIGRRFAGHTTMATTSVGRGGASRGEPLWQRAALLLVTVSMPLLLWWAFAAGMRAVGVSDVVLRDPWGVFDLLFLSEDASALRSALAKAFGQTLPFVLVGLGLGLAFAFVLAVVSTLWRGLGDTLLPVSLITQSMPLVALAPLIVLVFGRDALGTLAITVSVTFFPAFVTMAQGLALVPPALHDLVRANGGGRGAWLWRVALPWATPYLCAAARLAAPRAFLGVMIAEWLATGLGIGNLLNEARGQIDYGMIWSITVVSILAAVALYSIAAAAERRLLRRFALAPV